MTEQSNLPKLRFDEYTSNWKMTTLGQVSDIKGRIGYRGYTVGDIVEKDGAIAFSPSNIFEGQLNYKKLTLITWEKYEESPEIQLKDGDIIFVKTGSTYGKSTFITGLKQKATINPQIVVIKANSSVDSFFLSKMFRTSQLDRQVEAFIVGGAIPTMSQGAMSNFTLNIPSLLEQQKIASFLSKVDKKIELLTEKKAKLTEYKKGVMQQLFNGRFEISEQSTQDGKITFIPPTLRFKADDGSDFPDWEESRLGDVNTITGGGTPSTTVEDLWGGGIQWFTPTELKKKYVSTSKRTITKKGLNSSSAKILPKGTVLFSSRATVGDVGIALHECTTNQGFQSLNAKENKTINEFTYYWLITHKNDLLRRASGSTFLEISKSEIEKISMCLPVIEEQTNIANFLSVIDQKIELANSELEKAKQWKKGLLQQMFV